MTPSDLVSLLRTTVSLFRRYRVPHMLFGALALPVWGEIRATTDIDFMAGCSPQRLDRFAEEAEKVGLIRDRLWEERNPLACGWMVRLAINRVTVDISLPRDRHDATALERRKIRNFAGVRLSVVSAEDLILQKLKAGRPKDFDDASSIVDRQGLQLDFNYVSKWSRWLGITEEMNFILRHLDSP